jgi:hypothetical protein
MDGLLGVPQPPVTAVFDPTLQFRVTVLMGLIAAAGLIYALFDWQRTDKPTVLMLFLGGGFCMLVEPIVDVVGGCWHPRIGQWTVFAFFGRPMPVWLCLVYFVYFGIGIGLSWKLFAHGASRKAIWWLFVAAALGDFALEATLLRYNTYYYYGHQPLVVLKFPFWWAAVNALITVAAAATIYQLEPLLRGLRVAIVIPIAMAVSAFANFAAGWPSWVVINSDLSAGVTQLGGVATFALAAWFVYAITLTSAKDAPYRMTIGRAMPVAIDEVRRGTVPARAM